MGVRVADTDRQLLRQQRCRSHRLSRRAERRLGPPAARRRHRCVEMTTYVPADYEWNRRRLVYGDWTWLVRDGLDVLRFAFIAGTIVFAVQGRSTAVALTAASAVLLIARVVELP